LQQESTMVILVQSLPPRRLSQGMPVKWIKSRSSCSTWASGIAREVSGALFFRLGESSEEEGPAGSEALRRKMLIQRSRLSVPLLKNLRFHNIVLVLRPPYHLACLFVSASQFLEDKVRNRRLSCAHKSALVLSRGVVAGTRL
jgi:hypothetical protein